MEKQIIVDVKGMHCAACSSRIERVVSKMGGVEKAFVNLAAETLDITYKESETNLDSISKTVAEMGFELVKRNQNIAGELNLKLIGMHCAACSSRIERVVGGLLGVSSASVNLAAETGRFVFDKQKTSSRKIKKTIADLGFESEKLTSQASDFEKKEKEISQNLKRMKQRLVVEFILVIPLLVISMGEMVGLKLPDLIAPHTSPENFALTQLFLTLPIMWFGRNFYLNGIPALFRKVPNMDSLIAIGTGAAFIYSVWTLAEILIGIEPHMKAMDLYFESVGVLITLVSLGKYMETRSKSRTSDAIRRLMQLTPKSAVLLDGNEQKEIDVEEIEENDILLIKPGERVAVDGEIIKGESVIDESMMTGESIPVFKQKGEMLYGGTLNSSNALHLKALQTGENTMLARIIKMVQEAQGSKANIARIADSVSLYFVPIVIVIAILTGLSWYFLSDVGFPQSLRFFIAVMVIACPCAMGLATPISIMVGTGRGAQLGILIKNGETLEKSEEITTIVFDKTGTITSGKPDVTDFYNYSKLFNNDQILQLICSAEQSSEHPLGEAVVRFAEKSNIALSQPDSFIPFPGKGLMAMIDNVTVSIGNTELMDSHSIEWQDYAKELIRLSEEGKTVLLFAIDHIFSGVIAIADTIKPEVTSVIDEFNKKGVDVVMLTGDNKITADAIAREAGIKKVIAQVLPDGKANIIKNYQKTGQKVAMVGDGINDAPALAQADVGIAMGTGIDIAIESGDMVIMKGNLDGVLTALELSRAVMRNIRQNLFWAFGYNVVGIPVAAGLLFIFGGPTLNPMIAGAAMAMSSVSVVSNALRLRYFDR